MIIEMWRDGYKYYFKDKEMTIYHNDYGPDFTRITGYKTYYQNNKKHNPYGYAVIYENGDKSYYLNGEKYSYEEWLIKREKYIK